MSSQENFITSDSFDRNNGHFPDRKPSILIVGDDFVYGKILYVHLDREGYNCALVTDADAIFYLIENGSTPDLFIFDYNLGYNTNDMDICKRVKAMVKRPVLILTADNSAETTENCFNAGADYHLIKPYNKKELLARIGSLLRNHSAMDKQQEKPTGTDEVKIEIQLHHRLLTYRNKRMLLTQSEVVVLNFMIKNLGSDMSRRAVHTALYGNFPMLNSRSIDVLIGRIRKKLATVGAPYSINSVRNYGYVMLKTQDKEKKEENIDS